jgi:hypothetical protein
VLHGAVSGIAEVINNPGLVNVDFADVRTVMGEVGMAMMGSAMAAGADRARLAAEQAVRSPLLEDVNLAGARGVLVNVTASSGLRMREYQEVMTTIKEFTADDALVIVGTVIDDAMDDRLRVTMIATGLGGAQTARREQKAPNMTLVEQPQIMARRIVASAHSIQRRDSTSLSIATSEVLMWNHGFAVGRSICPQIPGDFRTGWQILRPGESGLRMTAREITAARASAFHRRTPPPPPPPPAPGPRRG